MRCEITDFGVRERLLDRAVVHGLAVRRHASAARERGQRDVVGEVLMDLHRLPGHRLLGVDRRRQRVVRDDDRVGRVTSEVAIRGDDDGDGFAGEAHDFGRDGAMLRRRERRADRHRSKKLRELLAGKHGFDAVHGFRGADVDRCDASVRDVAALERQVLHPDDLHVVNVGAQTLNEARVFAALDALTDQLRQYGSRHDYLLPAAYCTALTMC
jgi:hypothetical protein